MDRNLANAQGPPCVMNDCLAHDNVKHGIFTWWNTPSGRLHVIDRFIAYRNEQAAISVGA